MKKIISLILTVSIVGISFVFGFAEYDFNKNDITAERFAADVSNLISSSDVADGIPGEIETDSKFSTARLVVKSKKEINHMDAVSYVNGYDDLWVLQYSSPQKAEIAYNYYSANKDVEYVEADRKLNGLLTSSANNTFPVSENDIEKTYLSWGPEHIGIDKFNSSLIRNNIALSDVIVAVIDTGVDPDHSYLKGRVLPTKINTSASGIRNNSMDDNGHGTQVAGVIIDSTLDNVYVQPYKVLDNHGDGTVLTLAAGINCAVDDKVDVINISLGFKEESDVLKNAIDNAEQNDILVVSAAGNDGTNEKYYPASYESVVKVTAVNTSNIIANFSTYGNGVDFAAPGVTIKTTSINNETFSTKGTSVATPFVSAVAATIKATTPDASAEDIYQIMVDNCFAVNEHNASEKYGHGVISLPENYIGNNKEKVKTPYFSHKTAFSFEELDIEIFCDTPDAVIYYTTDRSTPSKTNPNAKIYDGTPIHASQTIIITAVAYFDGMYRSGVASFATIVAPYADEKNIVIDSDGTLLSYKGSAKSFSVPETVNGITVKSIGESAFENSDITEIILPDSVESIKDSAFRNCPELKTIYAKNVKTIGNNAFYNCTWIKNMMLLGPLTSIGEYSFYNTGSKQNAFIGSTFTLNLKQLTAIPDGTFSGSAIAELNLGEIKTIGKNAFLNCNQLVNVSFDYLMNMPDGCFRGCESLVFVGISGLSYIPISAFNSCENLVYAMFPDVKFVSSNAFENCVSLMSVSLPKATLVSSNAFSGCSKLTVLYLPAMTEFESTIYEQRNITPKFPRNLSSFIAPNLKKTVSKMFISCPGISTILLNNTTTLAPETFKGCHSIYYLNIESVEHINNNDVFSDCTISFIDSRSLVTTADMPDNSGILLSNNFIESTDTASNLTIYGTKGTFVERYAKLKGYGFREIPYLFADTPEFITDNSETVYVLAIGFDLTYQWYWNTVKSTEGGTPIEGANTSSYTFTKEDDAPYYYCEITQNDLGILTKITTNIITKDTVPADYSAYNKAVETAKAIDRNKYTNLKALDIALDENISGLYSCQQHIVDAQTQAIYNAIDSLIYKTVKSIRLFASETELGLFEGIRIITLINPIDSPYKDVEWTSDNEKVILVSDSGYVRCVGDGTATVYCKVRNIDGTYTEGSITFESDLNFIDRIIAFLLRPILTSIYTNNSLNNLIK